MASIKDISQEKSEDILTVLSVQNLFDFVDSGSRTKNIIKRVLAKKAMLLTLLFNICHLKNKVVANMGINPGKEVEKWISNILNSNSITTLSDLQKKQRDLPDLFYNN